MAMLSNDRFVLYVLQAIVFKVKNGKNGIARREKILDERQKFSDRLVKYAIK